MGKRKPKPDPRMTGDLSSERRVAQGATDDEVKLAPPTAKVKCERLPDDFPFIRRLADLYVEDWKRGATRDKQNRTTFYVSDVGKCPRRIFYDFKNADKKRDMAASTVMMFTFGDLFHEEIQSKVKRLGATAGKFIEFGTFSKINFEKRGRLDLFLHESELEGKKELTAIAVMEIKSKNPYAFDTEEPDEGEVDQLISYIHDTMSDPYILKEHVVSKNGYLFYVDRSGMGKPLPVAMWRVEYNEQRIIEIQAFFDKLWKGIQANRIPERPYVRDSIPCSYCRYLEWCWRGIPVAAEPKIEKDATIVPPSQEIVESMAGNFLVCKMKIKELERDMDLAEKVLTQYFKSKGTPTEISIGNTRITLEGYNDREIDVEFLLSKPRIKSKWYLIAKPQKGLLKEAVDKGIISGTIYERALVDVPKERIKVYRPKKAKEAKE